MEPSQAEIAFEALALITVVFFAWALVLINLWYSHRHDGMTEAERKAYDEEERNDLAIW